MVDVSEALEDRGIDTIRSGKDNVFISCPFHTESDSSCSVSLKTGGFHCFGCNERGGLPKLISAIDGISEDEARLLVYDGADVSGTLKKLKGAINNTCEVPNPVRYVTKESYEKKFGSLDDNPECGFYMAGRSIQRPVCEKFNIRYGTDGKWKSRVMMPITDRYGNIVGLTGRATYKGAFVRLWTYSAYEGALNSTLFGLWENRDLIAKYGALVIVEGPIDCMYLSQFGIPAVARLGKNPLTEAQLALILRFADVVYLSYDGDGPGREAQVREYTDLTNITQVIRIPLPDSKDPNNLDLDSIREIYGKYFEIKGVEV